MIPGESLLRTNFAGLPRPAGIQFAVERKEKNERLKLTMVWPSCSNEG